MTNPQNCELIAQKNLPKRTNKAVNVRLTAKNNFRTPASSGSLAPLAGRGLGRGVQPLGSNATFGNQSKTGKDQIKIPSKLLPTERPQSPVSQWRFSFPSMKPSATVQPFSTPPSLGSRTQSHPVKAFSLDLDRASEIPTKPLAFAAISDHKSAPANRSASVTKCLIPISLFPIHHSLF